VAVLLFPDKVLSWTAAREAVKGGFLNKNCVLHFGEQQCFLETDGVMHVILRAATPKAVS
jgi:hypothetical protein